MTDAEITRRRLYNQHIARATFETPDEVVRWLVAVQSQDYAGAKWALGLRMRAATDEAIDRAFADGAILRTHVMRPTWHFVLPADIRWLLALTAPRVHAINATMNRKLGLDSATLKRSNDILAGALQGGNQLTRDELREVLARAGIVAQDGMRLGYIVAHAELDGVICSGARRGKQFTYALLEERAPRARILEHDEALAELAGRYFVSRGPATVHDFAKWSGLTVTDARRGLEVIGAELQRMAVNGQEYWFPASMPAEQDPSPTAHLLSIYDEYISSYKDYSAYGGAEIGAKLFAMGNALTYIIVIDGQIAGTWRRALKKHEVHIETNLFRQLTEAENRALAAEAEAYGNFLGLSVVLT